MGQSPPTRRCHILMPRAGSELMVKSEHTECDRPVGHHGPHAFTLAADSRTGQYRKGDRFSWEDDDECDCCEPEETDHCFVWRQIPPTQEC